MHPHLERCRSILEDVTRGCGEEARARRDPAKWSVAEIVEHLTRAYSGTAKGFERCVEQGRPLAGAMSLKNRLQQFTLLTLGYFPEGRQAPRQVVPTGELDLHTLGETVARDLARLDAAAALARETLGAGKVLDHPIIGPLTVEQWLRFHETHTRHHARHIRARR